VTADPRPAAPPAAVPPSPLGANRDFTLLWAGAAATLLGTRASMIAYPFLVLWSTGSASIAGVVTFLMLLPGLIAQLPAGVLVDRWDRRRLMTACGTGSLLVSGSVAVAVLVGRLHLVHLLAAAFVEFLFAVFYQLAERVSVRHVVAPEQLRTALAQTEIRGRLAALLGQPLGGLLYATAMALPFLFTAATHAVSLLCLRFVRAPLQAPRRPPAHGMARQVMDGLAWIGRQRLLRTLLIVLGVTNVLSQSLGLAALVLVQQQGGSAFLVGLISGAAGVGGALGALSAPWLMRRASLRTTVTGAMLCWTVVMSSMVVVRAPWALAVVFAATAFAGGVVNVAGVVYQMEVTPDDLQGRVGSVLALIALGTGAIGALAGGFLIDAIGVAWLAAGCGLVMFALVLVTVAGFASARIEDL
jgi:predicted MFS family arabinose efflux permease